MKIILSLLAALLLPTSAFAWVGMAYSPSLPDVYSSASYGDPDTGIEQALELCKQYSKAKNECRPLGRPINGEVAVVMLGDVSWGVGYSKSPEKAMQAATKDCRRLSTTCTLIGIQLAHEPRYAAIAKSSSQEYFVSVNATSQASADKRVVDLCKKNTKSNCSLENFDNMWDRVFYAIAVTEDGMEYIGQYSTREKAHDKTIRFCEEKSKLPCMIVSGFPVENEHVDFRTETQKADFLAIGKRAYENAYAIRFPSLSKMPERNTPEQTSSRSTPAPKPDMGPCMKTRLYGGNEADVVMTPGCFE